MIVAPSDVQPRIKPGVAVAIVRECLAALAALHREGIVHGDIKPANIMLKCTGKRQDCRYRLGLPCGRSAGDTYLHARPMPRPRSWKAASALRAAIWRVLGYVLIEMLAGQPLFPAGRVLQDTAAGQADVLETAGRHSAH